MIYKAVVEGVDKFGYYVANVQVLFDTSLGEFNCQLVIMDRPDT